jgi:hypothetical protein
MCSIADGLRFSSSTIACIASTTDAKKIKPSPFARGKGTICSSADKIAANVPSLPDRISIRLPGAREKRSRKASSRTRRPCSMAIASVVNVCAGPYTRSASTPRRSGCRISPKLKASW